MFAGSDLGEREAHAPAPGRPILPANLRLFDGPSPAGAEIVDCGGRTVVPGLIDTVERLNLAGISEIAAPTADPAFIHLVSERVAEQMLMQGFTSIRDVSDPDFGLKLYIDSGILPGPRIFPPARRCLNLRDMEISGCC